MMGKSVNFNLGIMSHNRKQVRNQLIKEQFMGVFDQNKKNKAQKKQKKYLNRKHGRQMLKSPSMFEMQVAKCEIETHNC